jgi:hypothetical protein
MGMGRYVTIQRKLDATRYVCTHDLSKEMFHATIERRYRKDFGRVGQERDPGWCPFLMSGDEEGRFACSVHATRPRFCREFRCYSMKILDGTGTEIGRVKGRRTLATGDPELQTVWMESIASLSGDDDRRWRREVRNILERAGYGVMSDD